jgi:ribosomal protein S18 acetylase RimI-like enzyme
MGLGQMLLDYCDQVAQEKRKQNMWLGVWEKNLAAIRFYERNGFYKIDEHIFRLGDEDQTDHLMLKEFRQ